MNKHIFFAAFAALSLLVGVGCLVRALYLFKAGEKSSFFDTDFHYRRVFFGAVDFYSNMLYKQCIDGQPQIHSALFACGSQFVQSLYFGWGF